MFLSFDGAPPQTPKNASSTRAARALAPLRGTRDPHRPLLSALALLTLSCGPIAVNDPGPATPTVEYVTQQEVLTPLPLRVRLPASYGAEHVVVLHRTWGSRGWTQMELTRSGQTWAGEVSCRQVSTVTGDTRYFFVALDEAGELVGGSGSPDWPHVATIVGSLPGGPRSLTEGTTPLRCHDPSDCPPDFPGCPRYAFNRHACSSDRDCKNDRCAWDGYCGSPFAEETLVTTQESDEEQLAAAVRAVRSRYRKNGSASRASTSPAPHVGAR